MSPPANSARPSSASAPCSPGSALRRRTSNGILPSSPLASTSTPFTFRRPSDPPWTGSAMSPTPSRATSPPISGPCPPTGNSFTSDRSPADHPAGLPYHIARLPSSLPRPAAPTHEDPHPHGEAGRQVHDGGHRRRGPAQCHVQGPPPQRAADRGSRLRLRQDEKTLHPHPAR